MKVRKQSGLHPDDDIDISGLTLECGECDAPLERGSRRRAGFESQSYSVYPFECRTSATHARIEIYVPTTSRGGEKKSLSSVTVSQLELKSGDYLEPVARERQGDETTTYRFARRGRGDEIVVTLKVPPPS